MSIERHHQITARAPLGLSRNPGMPLDLDWVESVRVNASAVERRAATLITRRTVKKEWQAVRRDLLEERGAAELGIKIGAVCVYHEMVEEAVRNLRGSGIPVAAVSTGFPAGLNPFPQRLQEIEKSVAAGAHEIDIVISRRHVLTGNWQALYDEVTAFRQACGQARMKTILATAELGTLRNVMRASLVCMIAGADFINTSTG